MSARASRALLVTIALAAVACGSSSNTATGPGATPDAGGTSAEGGGSPGVDSGGTGADSGAPSSDGGSPSKADSGSVMHDAGGMDASAPDADSSGSSFATTYVAGTTGSGPGGINGSQGLTSGADQVALTSHSDLIVAGNEQINAQTGAYEIYDFRGTDGSLAWKFPSSSPMTLVGLDAQDGIYVLSTGPQSATLMELGPTGTTLRAASAPLFGGKVQTGAHVGGCVLADGTVILAGLSTAGGAVFQRVLPDGTLDWVTTSPSFESPWARVVPLSTTTALVLMADPSKPVDPDDNGAPVLGVLDVPTGAITTTAIALPTSITAVAPAIAIDAIPGPSGDFLVLLASGWLVDVLPSGVVQGSVLVQPTLVGFTGTVGAVTAEALARTTEGLMVVGSAVLSGSCTSKPGCSSQTAVSERYDLTLKDLGAFPTQALLGGEPAAWSSVASREGAVALAGTFLGETILLAKTHY